ncbi:MAG: phosphatidylinositol mannoside acyltransferase [Actinobacteria bacterium QS_8_72_14]|nr:MAG: phosphatidylinositol mannoside acyltransferase [Actinobacteria bacterium QS_8_72_14]
MRAPRCRGSGWPGVPVDRRPGAAERLPPAGPERRGLRLRAFLWNLVWEATRRVPERVAFAAADLVARAVFRFAQRSRQQVAANLLRALGPASGPDEVMGLVHGAFRSYGRYWVEAFRAADMTPAEVDARTTTEGLAHLDAALERGEGAIILLAHHGSWDVAARWAETHGYHLAVVAEIVRPRRLFEKFVRLREQIGLEVVPLHRGEDLAGRLAEALAANHLVGLLSDRDLVGDGLPVRLFGEACHVPHGPVTLARRTGAPVLPVTLRQQPGRRWHLQVLPAIELADLDVETAAQRVAAGLEAIIRTEPAQWYAFSPVWPADRHRAVAQPPALTLPRDVGTS